MSQPKKKTSRSRRDKRRYNLNNALKKVTGTTCPECGEPIRPHRLCSKTVECMSYKNRIEAKTSSQPRA